MKTTLIAATCLALTAFTANAHADDDTALATGAGGAITGAVLGGPVGAALGGIVGFAAGTAINPPPRQVVTYVESQPVPADAVAMDEKIVVGRPLSEDIVVRQVPDDDGYAYAFVNDQRVIIDPETRTVVKVMH